MSEWKTVPLSEVLTHRKEWIKVDDAQHYKLCRVQVHRRGVVLRGIKEGSEIKTKKQQPCKSGDVIVAEMDAKYGGYGVIPSELEGAVVSSHYYLYAIDNNKITTEYLQILFTLDVIQSQIEAKGSTNYSSIRAKEFLEYQIPLADIEQQRIIASKYFRALKIKNSVAFEANAQQLFLKQLRQAILQEAIEGKLTAQWRAENPVIKGDPNTDAQALLAQIHAEKQSLIAQGKLKKDKPLAPITDDKKPFELPVGWVWVRLGDIACGFDYGTSSKSSKRGVTPVLRMGNIQNGTIDWDDLVFSNDISDDIKYSLNKMDLLFNRTNSRELVGKTALFNSAKKAIFAGYLIRFTMLNDINPHYVNLLMNSKQHRVWCNYMKTDAIGQSNINATKLRLFLTPVPPLSEQSAIVTKVQHLLAQVDALETELKARQHHADQLMQSVLREAFHPNS